MKKTDESFDNSDKDARSNPTDSDELLSGFDERRRTFLKKLLITTAYVTPAILTLSMRDLEARRRRKKPTRNERKKKKKKKK
ncbi:MAG: hypothetical protein H8D23_24960 [Candidatus Brocadiales bacterium]|nr:hypothetical protein [Candidatus Brocadiales bacterium]